MDRFAINLNNLPQKKTDIVKGLVKNSKSKGGIAIVKGLISLGFFYANLSEIEKNLPNSFGVANDCGAKDQIRIAFSSDSNIHKFLSKFKDSKIKKSYLYLFLYDGIDQYISYLDEKKTDTKKDKIIFFCGLSPFTKSNEKETALKNSKKQGIDSENKPEIPTHTNLEKEIPKDHILNENKNQLEAEIKNEYMQKKQETDNNSIPVISIDNNLEKEVTKDHLLKESNNKNQLATETRSEHIKKQEESEKVDIGGFDFV